MLPREEGKNSQAITMMVQKRLSIVQIKSFIVDGILPRVVKRRRKKKRRWRVSRPLVDGEYFVLVLG